MEYHFREIEKKWQHYWVEKKTYQVDIDPSKPKFYVLDMFPYPSGAGLHVGHPLGYIASDIYARYKKLSGFNVLHPMGYDAYGLPAEQYAIQTGQHPAITTEKNITRYREQLDKIGFCYDWDREVRTCEPDYYHWTQWTFIQLFTHYYDKKEDKALPISQLTKTFSQQGNQGIEAVCTPLNSFTAEQWKAMDEEQQQTILLHYRMAYLADTLVNWCPKLGTVLANDEVVNGLSVRGGYPVVQKKMKQWSLRISAYAERLLQGLDTIDWSDSIKDIQRYWIGKSTGADVQFAIQHKEIAFTIFTTRPDTIFGVTFMVLAPESAYVPLVTTPEQQQAVDDYLEKTKLRTEFERQSDIKSVSGVFTGAYAINPFTQAPIPIWISDYVLASYGTGAIMAVPAHDSRDYAFAKEFHLPIIPVIQPTSGEIPTEGSYDTKEGTMINSGFITGMSVKKAILKTVEEIEAKGIGKGKINYRLRDAIFSRQRYWGEPFPVYFKNELPYVVDESELPIKLPEIATYLPTEDGQPPLGRAENWETKQGHPYELSTMPGFAGSSAYYLRYMDPKNPKELVSKEANTYWQDVDLYIGGTEHATGHLIYARFWNKFLFDLGLVCKEEPFKKLINQGMIQGRSNFVYRINGTNTYVTLPLKDQYEVTPIHVDVNIVHNDILDLEAFKQWSPDNAKATFILENDKYTCGYAVEKMSKSMYNVVNPDVIVEKYGADTLRLYEMFLGPLELSKPWDTNGIDGVHRFLKKYWRLCHNKDMVFEVSNDKPTSEELKILHKTIKKITDDIERFSFNTGVSAFMICVNELTDLSCNKRDIIRELTLLLAPFAPHITEEIWALLGEKESITQGQFPIFNPDYLVESSVSYPVSFNGKTRFKIDLPIELSIAEVEKEVLLQEQTQKWLEGKAPKKVIVVHQKIVNIVV